MNKRNKKRCNELVASIKSGKLCLPEGYSIPERHGDQKSFTTVRKATYRGKELHVESTYKIMIDKKAITAHTLVLNDGTVHCHAFPNYSFPSAMDLAKKIVDASSIEMPVDELGDKGSDHKGGH